MSMARNFRHVVLSLDLPHALIEVVQLLHDRGLCELGVEDFACVLVHISCAKLVRMVADGKHSSGHTFDRGDWMVWLVRRKWDCASGVRDSIQERGSVPDGFSVSVVGVSGGIHPGEDGLDKRQGVEGSVLAAASGELLVLMETVASLRELQLHMDRVGHEPGGLHRRKATFSSSDGRGQAVHALVRNDLVNGGIIEKRLDLWLLP